MPILTTVHVALGALQSYTNKSLSEVFLACDVYLLDYPFALHNQADNAD